MGKSGQVDQVPDREVISVFTVYLRTSIEQYHTG